MMKDFLLNHNNTLPKKNDTTLTILIVDDDIIILKYLSKVLEKEGFDTQIAHSGIEAIEIFKSKNIDIIFMDEVMPGGMSGHEAVKKIRSTSKNTKECLLNAGVDRVLYKPIDPKHIIDTIINLGAE